MDWQKEILGMQVRITKESSMWFQSKGVVINEKDCRKHKKFSDSVFVEVESSLTWGDVEELKKDDFEIIDLQKEVEKVEKRIQTLEERKACLVSFEK